MSESVPSKAWSNEVPTTAELSKFCMELWRLRLSLDTRTLFCRLAATSPPMRLAANLKSFIDEACVKDKLEDVLRDGINDMERKALCELDSSAVTVRSKEIAHGLLNMHSRWKAMHAMRRAFGEAWCSRRQRVGEAHLEEIFGHGSGDAGS